MIFILQGETKRHISTFCTMVRIGLQFELNEGDIKNKMISFLRNLAVRFTRSRIEPILLHRTVSVKRSASFPPSAP